jgi:hypothetical protein
MNNNMTKMEQEIDSTVNHILDLMIEYAEENKVSAEIVGNAFINLVIRTVPLMAKDLEELRQLGDQVKSAIMDAGVASGKTF